MIEIEKTSYGTNVSSGFRGQTIFDLAHEILCFDNQVGKRQIPFYTKFSETMKPWELPFPLVLRNPGFSFFGG